MTEPASQPAPPLPRAPGRRRGTYSASTKRTLVDVALELFAEQGYAATSLDQVVTGAEVTKGALYHHFSGKQALFEAAFERVQSAADATVEQALRGQQDPWEQARAGLRAFLEVVQQPAYRRLVVQDGPSVLGHERFREHEERSTFATVVDIVRTVLTTRESDVDEEMLETITRIFLGAMSSAGESVATSADPAAAAARVEAVVGFVLAGMRSLLDAGAGTTSPR